MIRVAVGIIEKHDRVLLCQRKRSSRYALKWEFPGGKAKENESLEECLQRELLEELNIKAEIGICLLKKVNVYLDGGEFEVSYFLVDNFIGRIRNKIFEKILWVDIAELSSIDMLEGNREMVLMLLEKQ
jgi:8-oxo-dGTP diphosphatase